VTQVWIPIEGSDRAPVQSREALRFEFVDEQGWDTSCGAAALASLLRRYRGLDLDEAGLLARGSPSGAQKLTLRTLVRWAEELGLTVRPWKGRYDDLGPWLAEAAPLLVHFDRPEGHFALLLALGPDGAVTADPARGLELLTRAQFEARWSGVAVEILDTQPASGQETVKKAVGKARGRARLIQRALSHPPGIR